MQKFKTQRYFQRKMPPKNVILRGNSILMLIKPHFVFFADLATFNICCVCPQQSPHDLTPPLFISVASFHEMPMMLPGRSTRHKH
jgi:hypothetical protein